MDLGEAVGLRGRARRVVEQGQHLGAERLGSHRVLQELGHHPPTAQQVRQREVADGEERQGEEVAQRRHAVRSDHRASMQQALEGGGARGEQQHVGRGQRRARLAVEQLEVEVRVAPEHLLDGRAQAWRGDRQHEADARLALSEPGGGREEWRREVVDLATATARQHRDQRRTFVHTECRAGRSAIDLRRDRLGQRMADEGRRHLVSVAELRLEREQRQ